MIDWVVYIAVGIGVGFAAGFFISRLDDSAKKKCEELEQKLGDAEQEMKHYRRDVTEHFIKTSGLINNMTDSYRAVYDHMAQGAKSLCSSKMLEAANHQNKLDIPTAKLIETEFESELESELETKAEDGVESQQVANTQTQQAETVVQQQHGDDIHEHPAELHMEIPDSETNSTDLLDQAEVLAAATRDYPDAPSGEELLKDSAIHDNTGKPSDKPADPNTGKDSSIVH